MYLLSFYLFVFVCVFFVLFFVSGFQFHVIIIITFIFFILLSIFPSYSKVSSSSSVSLLSSLPRNQLFYLLSPSVCLLVSPSLARCHLLLASLQEAGGAGLVVLGVGQLQGAFFLLSLGLLLGLLLLLTETLVGVFRKVLH